MEAQPAGWVAPQRPGMLTAVCVMGIVLGALWLLVSLMGVVGIFSQNLGASFAPNAEARRLQEEMQTEIQKAVGIGLYGAYGLVAAQFLLGVMLLYGGIRLLQASEQGRALLRITCLAATVFLILWLIVFVHNTLQTTNVTTTYMAKMMKAQQPQGGGPPADLFVGMTKVISMITLAISGLIALAEGVCFVLAANYLATDEVRAHFKEDS
jgi:hypothetical protein